MDGIIGIAIKYKIAFLCRMVEANVCFLEFMSVYRLFSNDVEYIKNMTSSNQTEWSTSS